MLWLSTTRHRLLGTTRPTGSGSSSNSSSSMIIDPNCPPPRCIITEIPLEVIFCIADHLSCANQLVLSHTCKHLYRSMKALESRRVTTLMDHRLYLWLLCKSKLDRYPCLDCNHIHHLDVMNLPTNRRSICPKEYTDRIHGSSLTGPFQLDYGHIQLACKLSQVPYRTLPRAYQMYLDRLLFRYVLQSEDPSWNKNTQKGRAEIQFQARLVVTENKCVLLRSWLVRNEGRHDGEIDSIFGSIQICPHENTSLHRAPSDPQSRYQQDGLRQLGRRILKGEADSHSSVCLFCGTDYSIRRRYKGYIGISTWQTLGGADFDSHRFWEEHSWRNGIPFKYEPREANYRSTMDSLQLIRNLPVNRNRSHRRN